MTRAWGCSGKIVMANFIRLVHTFEDPHTPRHSASEANKPKPEMIKDSCIWIDRSWREQLAITNYNSTIQTIQYKQISIKIQIQNQRLQISSMLVMNALFNENNGGRFPPRSSTRGMFGLAKNGAHTNMCRQISAQKVIANHSQWGRRTIWWRTALSFSEAYPMNFDCPKIRSLLKYFIWAN